MLCAGCRVGICFTTATSEIGCLIWNECLEKEDFVFYCHFCSAKTGRSCAVRMRIICLSHRLTVSLDSLKLARDLDCPTSGRFTSGTTQPFSWSR